ncbi:hypothetical protein DCAR_0311767 [Daucus carota subsp. sativus]|uniref:Replication protein A 70 kDa DNA-binding subunit B/D first OB fold domain-containing protein n=1 Tax=Daucus carota subsp. sativus TaxID=79200 RepID=A0A166AP56_DAUCS|nr:PREDICTED: uncharacterized protein LOC108213913 [Daucus carota subsp. sativus]WOG92498.1 hypothetical protein DCAR_0311767 [Daucus carota subsp. sativus]
MVPHHHVSAINQSRDDWMLKVRVTRKWPSLSTAGVPMRYNLIILDCQHNHIQAVVSPELWQRYAAIIEEGGLYHICSFRVVPAMGFFRPVDFPLVVLFNTLTVVNLVHEDEDEDDNVILMHKFKFTAFENLYERASNYNADHKSLYSTDVVGVLENLQPIQTVETRSGVKRIIRFTISDGRHIVDVCLWDPVNIDYEQLYEDDLDVPIIVILASARLQLRHGLVTISNLDSTKLYINLGHQDVFQMRQRIINNPFFM